MVQLPQAYRTPGSSSFSDFLAAAAPELLPGRRLAAGVNASDLAPHGTTVLALTCHGGVVMAGDRRATMGNLIAARDMQKVYAADGYSLAGIAGTAGIGIEMLRLFQVELEHYEKIEGAMLSLHGKANRLATMIRGNLPAAMQGLVALPIFAGFDLDADDPAQAGRIFNYDITGNCNEEKVGYDGIGSGSLFAKSALKKKYRPGLDVNAAAKLAIDALYDAADDDTATGGPDMARKIYPVVYSATADGTVRLDESTVSAMVADLVAAREQNPGG